MEYLLIPVTLQQPVCTLYLAVTHKKMFDWCYAPLKNTCPSLKHLAHLEKRLTQFYNNCTSFPTLKLPFLHFEITVLEPLRHNI